MQAINKLKIVKHSTKDDEKIRALTIQVEAELEKATQTHAKLNTVINTFVNVKTKIDSLAEVSEAESMRLQVAMDRFSKMMTMLSNLLKKSSDTANSITQNLK